MQKTLYASPDTEAYRMHHASARHIPRKQIQKFVSGNMPEQVIIDAVDNFCALAKHLGRDPCTSDIPSNLLDRLKSIGKKWYKLLPYAGLIVCANEQHEKAVANFKNSAASWRGRPQLQKNTKDRGVADEV